MVGAQVIKEKMICVNDPSYLEQKQQLLDKMAQETGQRPKRAIIEKFEYLRIMSEAELQVVLIALLPIIKLEERP